MTIRRRKSRYLMFSISSANSYQKEEVEKVIEKSVLRLYGIKGLSQISPQLIRFDENSQKGILRCNYLYLRPLRASLAFIDIIRDANTSLHVEKVSGSLKTLKNLC